MEKSESRFTGNVINHFLNKTFCLLATIFTLGFAAPWAIVRKEKYLVEHTLIDGKALYFDGEPKELFSQFMKWFAISVITLGAYSLVSSLRLKKWSSKHTHFVKEEEKAIQKSK